MEKIIDEIEKTSNKVVEFLYLLKGNVYEVFFVGQDDPEFHIRIND